MHWITKYLILEEILSFTVAFMLFKQKEKQSTSHNISTWAVILDFLKKEIPHSPFYSKNSETFHKHDAG